MSETLILVDRDDIPQGFGEKMEVHQKGLRHRAFSVMIYNERGQLLMQKRADCKYHSPGLWANSCCGHPRPGENTKQAAERRLMEELGFTCSVRPISQVSYTLNLDNGLSENETTHVFSGVYTGPFTPNIEEVSDISWQVPEAILTHCRHDPSSYARWFRFYLLKYFDDIFALQNRIKK
jgi:isopentenyl-diphosphate Delta-isomerase